VWRARERSCSACTARCSGRHVAKVGGIQDIEQSMRDFRHSSAIEVSTGTRSVSGGDRDEHRPAQSFRRAAQQAAHSWRGRWRLPRKATSCLISAAVDARGRGAHVCSRQVRLRCTSSRSDWIVDGAFMNLRDLGRWRWNPPCAQPRIRQQGGHPSPPGGGDQRGFLTDRRRAREGAQADGCLPEIGSARARRRGVSRA